MIDFLNWTIEDDFAITSPQIIAYQDADNNVTVLPCLQFVAKAEQLGEEWYPVVFAVDSQGVVVWKTTRRKRNTFESAFNLAIGLVGSVFIGSYEDGCQHHDMLNSWACEILQCLPRDKKG